MISQEVIRTIIAAGCAAPSGGNSQPWEFKVENDAITIFSKPEKDHPVLNVFDRGTLIAHGALIENISIAAASYGLLATVKILPEKKGESLTNLVQLTSSGKTDSEGLSTLIFKRATNRKPYEPRQIPDNVLRDLQQAVRSTDSTQVVFLTKKEDIQKIAEALSVSDKIMFENKVLHGLFFKELVWNQRHEQKKGGGLLLQTLELKLPQQSMLHLLQYWPVMRIAAKLGIARQIAKENAQTHSACSLLCCIRVSKNRDAFVEAGRQIERLWLMAAKHGLSVQINTGLFFFWQGIDAGTVDHVFSEIEKKEITAAYDSVASLSTARDDIVTAVLRIGYGGEPSVRSIRSAPVVTWAS